MQVVPTTVSFSDAWDGDDTLVYEPESTAAFILSKWLGNVDADAAMLAMCKYCQVHSQPTIGLKLGQLRVSKLGHPPPKIHLCTSPPLQEHALNLC